MSIDIGVRRLLANVADHPYLLSAAFLGYVTVYIISVYFSGGRKGKNPFQNDCRRPPEPFVHETKARDAVLKERFKESKIPENLDVVIIGSGIGGLSAGVLLARAGKKVLILEQHDQAGGCCHTFIEKGFEFDTGIHYIGNMHYGSVTRTLIDQLTCGQLRWFRMDDAFDKVALGKSSAVKWFDMKSGKERYYQNLVDMFPNEKTAILIFKDLIKDACDSFNSFVLLKVLSRWLLRLLVATSLHRIAFKCYRKGYVSKTLQEVLDGLTDNKELKLVLSYICGDYGVLPKEVPFVLHALLIDHYERGAYYPQNGTSEIAFHIVQAIRHKGGNVLVQAPVTKILCDSNGRAVGVQVGKNNVKIHAKFIISDAGLVNTFRKLLPEEVARKSNIYPLIDKVGQSCSFITAFIGVEGSSSELKLPASNIWLYETNDINELMTSYLNQKNDDIEAIDIPFGFISFPSAKDPEWEKKFPGKSSVLFITVTNWEWFEEWQNEKLRHRGDRYEGIKDAIGRKMWQQCVDLFPQLDGKKVYMEVGTPVTNQFYLACPRGEMYGLDHKRERFSTDVAIKLRPDTDIQGLYLTGQDLMICGFTPALLVGLMCASSVLNRNLYFDLLKLRKDIRKRESLDKLGFIKKEE